MTDNNQAKPVAGEAVAGAIDARGQEGELLPTKDRIDAIVIVLDYLLSMRRHHHEHEWETPLARTAHALEMYRMRKNLVDQITLLGMVPTPAEREQDAPETIRAKVDRVNLQVMRRFASMWHADAVRLGYDGVGSLLESLLSSHEQSPASPDAGAGAVAGVSGDLPRYIIWDSKHPDYPVEWTNPGRPTREGELGFFRHDVVNELIAEAKEEGRGNASQGAYAAALNRALNDYDATLKGLAVSAPAAFVKAEQLKELQGCAGMSIWAEAPCYHEDSWTGATDDCSFIGLVPLFAAPASAPEPSPLLMQDENSGRDGRRYNEWHASRPDARINAREAAAGEAPEARSVTSDEDAALRQAAPAKLIARGRLVEAPEQQGEALTDAQFEDATIELFTAAQGPSPMADKLGRIDEILRRLCGDSIAALAQAAPATGKVGAETRTLIDALDRYLRQDETAGDTDNGTYRQGTEAMQVALKAAQPDQGGAR